MNHNCSGQLPSFEEEMLLAEVSIKRACFLGYGSPIGIHKIDGTPFEFHKWQKIKYSKQVFHHALKEGPKILDILTFTGSQLFVEDWLLERVESHLQNNWLLLNTGHKK